MKAYLSIAAMSAIAASIITYLLCQPAYQPVASSPIAPVIVADARVADVPREIVAVPTGIKTLPARVKVTLNLPPVVAEDDHQHVADAAVVDCGDKQVSVVAVLDDRTGETKTMATELARPWLRAENSGKLWLGYGINDRASGVIRASLIADLIQIKSAHVGALVSADSGGGRYGEIGVSIPIW